ncbi:hypothetical protein GCM10027168_11330 [Streptomyces capparidis]
MHGATLHYEVRGQGPLLLLISGGAGDAASFDGFADDLAAEYTVATYDPRGMSRSTLDDPGAEQTVAEHADDAFRRPTYRRGAPSAGVRPCSERPLERGAPKGASTRAERLRA